MKPLTLIPAFLMLFCASCMAQKRVSAKNAARYQGQEIMLCDSVFKTGVDGATHNTLLYVGTPAQYAIVLVKQQSTMIKWHPETQFKDHAVCATGKLVTYNGTPAIYITENNKLKLDIPVKADGNK